ncbi:MAG: hypothetical protein WA690_06275 [Candidatus Acidiferrales bacterium]
MTASAPVIFAAGYLGGQLDANSSTAGSGVSSMILLDHPLALLVATVAVLWIASRLGFYIHKHTPQPLEPDEDDFALILGATLTLLGLIIGFTFSMAVNRYDQRKNYEEQEANAIGTEYLRLGLSAVAANGRMLLRDYLDQRIIYYTARDPDRVRQTRVQTSQLESQLWSTLSAPGTLQPTPISALVLSGMNDVLNSEGYTEAAWRNRVPLAAWILLVFLAVFSNVLLGYRAHRKSLLLFLVLPIALSISFLLIADIDSPRTGVIRVYPQNLESLAGSLRRLPR